MCVTWDADSFPKLAENPFKTVDASKYQQMKLFDSELTSTYRYLRGRRRGAAWKGRGCGAKVWPWCRSAQHLSDNFLGPWFGA